MNAIAEGYQAVVIAMLHYCKVTEMVQYKKTLLEWAIQNDHSVLIKVKLRSTYNNNCTSKMYYHTYLWYNSNATMHTALLEQDSSGKWQALNISHESLNSTAQVASTHFSLSAWIQLSIL